jgi:hypothetical protein
MLRDLSTSLLSSLSTQLFRLEKNVCKRVVAARDWFDVLQPMHAVATGHGGRDAMHENLNRNALTNFSREVVMAFISVRLASLCVACAACRLSTNTRPQTCAALSRQRGQVGAKAQNGEPDTDAAIRRRRAD